MKIIDKKQLKAYVRSSLKNDCTIKIYTFKKDRSIMLIKYKYQIIENGFYKRKFRFLIKNEAIKSVMRLVSIEFRHMVTKKQLKELGYFFARIDCLSKSKSAPSQSRVTFFLSEDISEITPCNPPIVTTASPGCKLFKKSCRSFCCFFVYETDKNT